MHFESAALIHRIIIHNDGCGCESGQVGGGGGGYGWQGASWVTESLSQRRYHVNTTLLG